MTQRPLKIYAGRSRMDDTPAREGDIPAYFLWDDGSEYEVFESAPGMYTRRFCGPLFGCDEWRSESWEKRRIECGRDGDMRLGRWRLLPKKRWGKVTE